MSFMFFGQINRLLWKLYVGGMAEWPLNKHLSTIYCIEKWNLHPFN